MNPHILILAAGKGKRMYSQLPKVLHPALFRPMLHHVLELARSVPHQSLSVIVGHGEELVREACQKYDGVQYFRQAEQLGTGHAVMQAKPLLEKAQGPVVVLCGDVILLRPESLKALLAAHEADRAAVTVVTAKVDDPHGYGRIVKDAKGQLQAIREEADCSDAERKINEVNSGIYCFEARALVGTLDRIGANNRQKEYYLTDAIEILRGDGQKVATSLLADAVEMTGVNDRLALHEVEKVLQRRTNRELMKKGVTLRDPETTFIDPFCRIAPDTTIEGGAVLVNTTVAAGVRIESLVRLVDSEVGENAHVKQGTYVEKSYIGPRCSVGPYAHLRPESRLEEDVKIGNFVELKKSKMGKGAKASHLAYIGDADVGADSNLGCGFITCNYDGFSKHKTIIEEGVFVGSDSQIVAPVRLGKGSYVASGTTVTHNVPADGLALARVKQVNKEGYAAILRARGERNKKK